VEQFGICRMVEEHLRYTRSDWFISFTDETDGDDIQQCCT